MRRWGAETVRVLDRSARVQETKREMEAKAELELGLHLRRKALSLRTWSLRSDFPKVVSVLKVEYPLK